MSKKPARTLLATLTAAALSLGLSACADNKDTYELHYATYSNSVSDQSKTVQAWAKRVEELTGGAVTVRFHYSQSLIGADEAANAIVDGRVDIAQVGSLYSASDLPMYTVAELPFETQNPHAHMRTVQRMYEESAEYREDFYKRGTRQLFPLPIGAAVLGTTTQVTGSDDLTNKNIRSGGLVSQVMQQGGANPVAMTATDVYESMERGIIDGYTSLGMSNLPTFGLAEDTNYISNPGVGLYGSSLVGMSEDLFDKMPENYQQALLQASEEAIDIGLEELDEEGTLACTLAKDVGTEFIRWPEDEMAALEEASTVADEWISRNESRGYNARTVIDDYRRILSEEEDNSTYKDALDQCIDNEVNAHE